MKEIYGKLREEHVELLRTVCHALLLITWLPDWLVMQMKLRVLCVVLCAIRCAVPKIEYRHCSFVNASSVKLGSVQLCLELLFKKYWLSCVVVIW